MNLHKLYEIQGGLDYRIHEKFSLQAKDVLMERLLAFLVELGEAANDWRGFKFWSENKEAKETLLEEYVDGLHFILSIGNTLLEMDLISKVPLQLSALKQDNITEQFLLVYAATMHLHESIQYDGHVAYWYASLFETFLGLGELLGFLRDEIEAAYMEKNAENHNRQDNGY
ncbi:dUTP diphosphatase [Ectobacillus ponti]|uniref:dUTP diphosphatase n=1 Tax=Ectobacillus ponti TaxID=2961894 RepID=A0AA41XB46_9BACI|nr:dUTP diphosphatase [Ectobacillus ponti]MCP8969705.1 dUTP diphosphatase [Ectobacillus ponti]